jgi:hypothetical protein
MHRISFSTALGLLMPAVGILIPRLSTAQVLNNSATINITSGTSVYVVGDLTNQASGVINNSGTLEITGNNINNGTVSSPGGSNLVLGGSAAQTVSGTTPMTANNLEIDNAAGITLSTPLTVNGVVSFTAGLINTSATNPLIIGSSGSVSSIAPATDGSHVNGTVRKLGTGSFSYPIGNAARLQPVSVNLTANSAGMSATYQAVNAGSGSFSTAGSQATALVAYNTFEYWDLTPVGSATGSVTIAFDDYNNRGISNTGNLRVAHKSGGAWLNEGAASVSGTIASGTVTSNAISTWSPFTLGSISNASPLPVVFNVCNAKAAVTGNVVEFSTASENPQTDYHVQRSTDAREFTEIAQVLGHGAASSYVYTDLKAPQVDCYYRVKALTGGVLQAVSPVLSVIHRGTEELVSLSPTSVTESLTLKMNSGRFVGRKAIIVDGTGKTINTFTISSQLQTVDARQLLPGAYILSISEGPHLKFRKN